MHVTKGDSEDLSSTKCLLHLTSLASQCPPGDQSSVKPSSPVTVFLVPPVHVLMKLTYVLYSEVL